MKRTAILVVVVLSLLALAHPGFARGGVELRNAFEVDADGNLSAASLQLNGKPFGIGDSAAAGVLENLGSHPVFLAFSNERTLKLLPGEATVITAEAVATQECRCKCGAETVTLPSTDATSCKAHNGERCEYPKGTFRTLTDCALTWVFSADPVDPVGTGEPIQQ